MTDVAEASSAIAAKAVSPAPSGVLSGPRLEQFEAEITKLKVKGGRADRERILVILGVIATIAGFVVTTIGITGVRNASDQLSQGDSMSLTILGVGIAIVGCGRVGALLSFPIPPLLAGAGSVRATRVD